MSKTSYSSADSDARTRLRAATAAKTGTTVHAATFAYSSGIAAGTISAEVHPTLSPNGLKIRECRDSDQHPETFPVALTVDTTGSMQDVPIFLQKELNKLMGYFLAEKVSGKHYLGENGTPSILISAVDDYVNGEKRGCAQVSEWENDIKIDDCLTNLWITGNGGGGVSETPPLTRESYILALYAAARHTSHDRFDKRGKKGCWFIIGDEASYTSVTPEQIQYVFGETLKEAVGVDPKDLHKVKVGIKTLIEEASKLYEIFFILPNHTSHWGDKGILNFWKGLLPQGHVLELEDLDKICELIAGCVAMCGDFVDLDDLKADGMSSVALAPLKDISAGAVARKGQFAVGDLPTDFADAAGSSERL